MKMKKNIFFKKLKRTIEIRIKRKQVERTKKKGREINYLDLFL